MNPTPQERCAPFMTYKQKRGALGLKERLKKKSVFAKKGTGGFRELGRDQWLHWREKSRPLMLYLDEEPG